MIGEGLFIITNQNIFCDDCGCDFYNCDYDVVDDGDDDADDFYIAGAEVSCVQRKARVRKCAHTLDSTPPNPSHERVVV